MRFLKLNSDSRSVVDARRDIGEGEKESRSCRDSCHGLPMRPGLDRRTTSGSPREPDWSQTAPDSV